MKLLIVLLSLFTITYLSIDLINDKEEIVSSNKLNGNDSLVLPPILSATKLPFENKWEEVILSRKTALDESKIPENNTPNKDMLTIGDQSYHLYGIFNENDTPFVLLKSKESDFIKLNKGDALSNNTTLSEVSNNRISFKVNDDYIEFKLFE